MRLARGRGLPWRVHGRRLPWRALARGRGLPEHGVAAALLAAALALVLPGPALALPGPGTVLPAPAGTWNHRFLTLPFPDPHRIHIQDAWWREDGTLHNGIDYIRGRVDQGWTWESFPIVAAADGWACAALDATPGCIVGVGTRVLIRHQLPSGRIMYTYYGHLSKVARRVAVGTNTFSTYVRRGQLIGWAGRTGYPGTGIHLHFELLDRPGAWIDPYDLYGYRAAYPDPMYPKERPSGPKRYWTRDPPVPPRSPGLG
jgi:murein DD-endopeptidase MepM/ murein hydrolase activator NlpD